MDDLDLFLTELDARRAAAPPFEPPSSAALDPVIRHPRVQAALARARDTTFRPGDTGLLWEGGKNVEVRRTPNWRVMLMQRPEPPAFLKTTPHFTLSALLDGPGARLRRLRVDGDLGAPAARAQATLAIIDERPLALGEPFVADDPAQVLDIAAEGPTVVLTIQGARLAPHQHAFRRATRAYAFTSFADEEITGRHFFVDMVKRLTAAPSFRDRLAEDERADVARFMADAARAADSPASVRWSALQTVARLTPREGREILSGFRDDADGVLSAQARSLDAA